VSEAGQLAERATQVAVARSAGAVPAEDRRWFWSLAIWLW